uniref:Uncharacterized protein n=1 Tax=Anguilla anguilla TaxID=7936 RepID=A0A0E9S160_ANGAN
MSTVNFNGAPLGLQVQQGG